MFRLAKYGYSEVQDALVHSQLFDYRRKDLDNSCRLQPKAKDKVLVHSPPKFP